MAAPGASAQGTALLLEALSLQKHEAGAQDEVPCFQAPLPPPVNEKKGALRPAETSCVPGVGPQVLPWHLLLWNFCHPAPPALLNGSPAFKHVNK